MKFTTTLLGLGLSLASIAVAAPTGGWPGVGVPNPLDPIEELDPADFHTGPAYSKPVPKEDVLPHAIKEDVLPNAIKEWVRPNTDLPQPVHFAGEKTPYQVISVTRVNKRGHVEDYDMTYEEELEREMCNVSFWDAVTGSAFEKVYECQYWHNLEDDGWNAGQWEHDGDESD
ncbi:hypothetical protein M409DRAFT_23623 [Zasmidium cellare ATCC 36951]|uniref:Uncharacterized protein n=1 Tax=Zasmidium cellare ATCC 36951 TaxID=1080233 RepID=A0A6A6CFP8_ZASCE|nr:uncharacterized protein M409DRAFT_23623 [Zasmidium cellare ATCC 36951]KAF2165891.1 hypothetical protein M409DRAFT_23623 [Zasmidium cellare ATCC 36951]